MKYFASSLLLASLSFAIACGDDDGGTGDAADMGIADAGADAGAGTDDAGTDDAGTDDGGTDDMGVEPSRFVVCGLTAGPEGLNAYASVVDSLDADVDIDLAETLPIPGFGFCLSDGESLFTGTGESNALTRWAIDDEGNFSENGRLSFMGEGIGLFSPRPGRFQIISPTKAYYIDDATLQIVVWNPSEFVLEGTISLDGLEPTPGNTVGISPIINTGDRIVIFSGENDGLVNTQTGRVAILDTATDTVVYDTDERCGGFSNISGFAQDDGTVYVASGTFTGASFQVGLEGSFEPCALRVLPDEDGFDDDYFLELGTVTADRLAAEVQRGPGGGAYTIVYDETVRPFEEDDDIRAIQNAPVWRVHLIEDMASPTTATSVDGLPLTSGVIIIQEFAGRIFYVQTSADFSSSNTFDVTDPSNIVPAISPPGLLGFIGVLN